MKSDDAPLPTSEATRANAIVDAMQPGVKTSLTREQFDALAPEALETIVNHASLSGHPPSNHFIAALGNLKVGVTKSDESGEYLWCVGRVSDTEDEVKATLKQSEDGSQWELYAGPAMSEAVDKGKGKEVGLVIEKTPPGFATAHTELTEEIEKRVLELERPHPPKGQAAVPELLEHQKLVAEAEKRILSASGIYRIKRALAELEFRRVTFSFMAANPKLAYSFCQKSHLPIAGTFQELLSIACYLSYATKKEWLMTHAGVNRSKRQAEATEKGKSALTENTSVTDKDLENAKMRLQISAIQRDAKGGPIVLGASEHQQLGTALSKLTDVEFDDKNNCRALLAELEARGVCLSFLMKQPELRSMFLDLGLKDRNKSFESSFNILAPLAKTEGIGNTLPEWEPLPVQVQAKREQRSGPITSEDATGQWQNLTPQDYGRGKFESAVDQYPHLIWGEGPTARRSKMDAPEK